MFIVISACLFFLYKNYGKLNRAVEGRQVLLEKKRQAWLQLKVDLKNRIKYFKGTVSLVVTDLDSNWEIAFNKNVLIPSASLVKIPIMLAYFYAAQDGKVNLKDTLSLENTEKVSGSKVLGGKPSGSVFTVEELFEPMITQSDNTAANELIDFLGFDLLNTYFKKIGLKNTNIVRKMMDFAGRKKGVENYTTAQDMAYLLKKLYYKNFLNKDVSEKCLGLLGQQRINDRIPRKLPKNLISVAHKTGLERHICHDVGILFTNKGNFLICVLVKHKNKLAQPAKRLISDIALIVYNYCQSY